MAGERRNVDHEGFIQALLHFDPTENSQQQTILQGMLNKYPGWLNVPHSLNPNAPASSSSSEGSSYTPLEYAISNNKPELFQYLLKQSADPSIKSGTLPSLAYIALARFLDNPSQPEFLLELLKYGVDPFEEREEYDLTPSPISGPATPRKKISIFTALDKNVTPEIRAFALISAIKQGKQTETQQLLETDFSSTEKDHLGKTALQHAAESRNPLIHGLVLAYAVACYQRDIPQGKTLKDFLAKGGNPFHKIKLTNSNANDPLKSVVDLLQPNSKSGWSDEFQSQIRALILIWAIKHRDTANVQALCKEGNFDFDGLDHEGKSALQYAAECDIDAIRNAVVNRYKNESNKGTLAASERTLRAAFLIEAINKKREALSLVDEAEKNRIRAEEQDKITEICEALNPIAFEQTDHFGRTALHLAIASEDSAITRTVLAAYQKGLTTTPAADLSKIGPTKIGKNTPLHIAALLNQKENFLVLLKMGISPAYKNKEGKYALECFPPNNTLTPLEKQECAYYMLVFAVKDTDLSEQERKELAQKAVELGANCMQRLGETAVATPRKKLGAPPLGKTLLLEAIEKKNVPMINFLIEQAPELIHAKNLPPNNEPLLKQVLVHFKPPQRLDVIEMLLQKGADGSVFYLNHQINAWLWNELVLSDKERKEFNLLIAGYELHRLIRVGETEQVKGFLALLERAGDPEWLKRVLNFKDTSGSTPLGIVSKIKSPYWNAEKSPYRNTEIEALLNDVASRCGVPEDAFLEKVYEPLSSEAKKNLYDSKTDAIQFTLGLPPSPADLLGYNGRFDLRDLFKKDEKFFEQIARYSDNKHSFSVHKLSPIMAALTCASCLFTAPAVTLNAHTPISPLPQRMLTVYKDHCEVPGNISDPKTIATVVFAIAATFKAGIIANNGQNVPTKHYEVYELQGEPVVVPYVHISNNMTLGQLKEYITQYYEQGVIPSVDKKIIQRLQREEDKLSTKESRAAVNIEIAVNGCKEAAAARFHTRYLSRVEGGVNKIAAIQKMKNGSAPIQPSSP